MVITNLFSLLNNLSCFDRENHQRYFLSWTWRRHLLRISEIERPKHRNTGVVLLRVSQSSAYCFFHSHHLLHELAGVALVLVLLLCWWLGGWVVGWLVGWVWCPSMALHSLFRCFRCWCGVFESSNSCKLLYRHALIVTLLPHHFVATTWKNLHFFMYLQGYTVGVFAKCAGYCAGLVWFMSV